ncbi:LLM class flavin-dependent oxidoreductase [Antribacter gilvus]|uniref:LLM class flavin-dependent oxidoreductase n=1 Tax=Antribacter gilvus TaxID=2304675 RepID=UPI000F77A719|nr:LLM class flavin-dependent oxidoreductase [Antribacter gilvus]
MTVELGIDTFGDVTFDDAGRPKAHAQVLRDLVEQGVLADQVGLDVIGVGEHHREDFAVSAPEVVLAAIAARTEHIRLSSAVTVLSSDDPVRVYQRFATLDGLSEGRAEVVLGRGSFTESFPLFGYDLQDYEALFEEKLALFAALLPQEPVTWEGRLRPSIDNFSVYPRVEGTLRTWVGVGGSPQSVVRAASHGLPLVVAIIGGASAQFGPIVDLYHRALEKLGKPDLPVAVHSPGHVADTDEEAKEQLWPHYEQLMNRIGRERGWGPTNRSQFEATASREGALYVGSPETVARKIATTVKTLGLSRFDLKYANGTLPHSQLMRSIELYGTRVAPLVKDLLAEA